MGPRWLQDVLDIYYTPRDLGIQGYSACWSAKKRASVVLMKPLMKQGWLHGEVPHLCDGGPSLADFRAASAAQGQVISQPMVRPRCHGTGGCRREVGRAEDRAWRRRADDLGEPLSDSHTPGVPLDERLKLSSSAGVAAPKGRQVRPVTTQSKSPMRWHARRGLRCEQQGTRPTRNHASSDQPGSRRRADQRPARGRGGRAAGRGNPPLAAGAVPPANRDRLTRLEPARTAARLRRRPVPMTHVT